MKLSKCFFTAINMAEAKKKLDKPLLRRKSELPTDVLTQKSLETYKVQKRRTEFCWQSCPNVIPDAMSLSFSARGRVFEHTSQNRCWSERRLGEVGTYYKRSSELSFCCEQLSAMNPVGPFCDKQPARVLFRSFC